MEQINQQWKAITVIIAALSIGALLGRFTSLPARMEVIEAQIESSKDRISATETAMAQLTSQVSRLICVTTAERENRSALGC